MSSAETMITRRQRPARIQSSATRHGLRRARAGRIDLRVRTARADQFGELRVPHREHAEQETAVERVRLLGRSRARSSAMRRSISCARDRVAVGLGRAVPQALQGIATISRRARSV